MAESVTKRNEPHYICRECGFAYKTKELARECEDWCRKHHSCSLEITRHAVNIAGQQ